ncbi:FHA domain-containing protein [Variovorax paradoxus]|jgi:FHA domain-containing protein|uniref:type VI secretion system-associated FHA domain protein TagH n=1 Tax=Variovorax paradoxus TaxID=34073 RepID=UPI0027947102|nr:type VI secretion system-associated FHA domain protein TagH [Variovorax paradoxus]MDQ0573000.1 FHA domain-containing protein [Variovorax paradoxus]
MRWTVIEHAGKPVTSGPSALLAAPGGTIGRSPDNHLVLPDEQRQISRLQATVRFDEQGIEVLRNMSAVLPISVNGRTLQHEEESPVADGDRVTIGSYVLEAVTRHRAATVAPIAPIAAAVPMPPPAAAPMRDVPVAGAMAQAPMDSLLPAAPVSDVFSDLFGAGALPIGDAQAVTVAMPPAASPPLRAEAPVAAPMPAMPAAPAFASPLAPVPSPSPAPASASQIPSAADWDAILANAPRREKSAPEPMPDPMAHEPFELPSQARRNPVDPLAELNPHAASGMSDVALKRGVDPLSFFAADSNAPSPLSDPRPTALTHEDPLSDLHPALDLLAAKPVTSQGPSHSNHAREVSAQFRPPIPVAFDPPPAAKPMTVEVAAAPAEPLRSPPQAVSAPAEPVSPPASAPAPAARVDATPPAKAAPPEPAAPPQPKPAAMPPVTVAAAPLASPTAPASSSSDELFRAFLEGAGVPDVAGQQPLDADAMRRLGRLMRAFTDGTIELLSSRAMLKREVRAEITMIVEEENNPFKILPNGRAVLMQMFGARMPGFLSPEAAVHDALGDLQSHQLGMVAGMRAALLTVLKRFDPTALNTATPHDGGLGEKLLPGGREARLWRQLQKLHAETTAAVEDDFQAVFGRAFQQAYDKEMERLKEARRA